MLAGISKGNNLMISIVFYCFMINDWREKLSRQINRIVSSGLYEAADELFLFVTDESNNLRPEVEDMIKDLPKIKLDYTTLNYGEGFLALSKVEDLAKEEGERKILYFHTKGVFNKYKNFETKEINNLKLKGVECWVEMMEYFLIDNWARCVEKLNDNDIVGTICNAYWWWGNFWWTRSSHVKNIPSIRKFYSSRWSAEAWIHESAPNKEETVKYYQFKPTRYDLYYSVLPKYFYDNSIELGELKIDIKEAKFGYFAEQRDEGRGPPQAPDQFIDVTDKLINLIGNDPRAIINQHQLVEPGVDVAHGHEKSLRIKFSTNIDPENEYVITSFMDWDFTIVS